MKKAKKNIILLIAAAAVLIAAVFGLNIQSVDEYYSGGADGSSSEIQSRTVTLEIRCDTVLKNYEELDNRLKSDEYVPPDGVFLPVTEYELIEGDTVFSVLKRAVREKKIQMEYQGADGNGYKTVYVQGIHHLYEFSCGPLSGWMYRVNGEFPNKGCSDYELKDGDVIEWVYTCDLGQDIGGIAGGTYETEIVTCSNAADITVNRKPPMSEESSTAPFIS